MKSYWTEHKGKRVFVADYSRFGLNSSMLRKEADEVIAALEQEPLNSVLSVSNVIGTTASTENIEILKSILPHSNKIVRKRCVVGVEGVRWYFIKVFNRLTGAAKLETFSTLEEALDWIVKD